MITFIPNKERLQVFIWWLFFVFFLVFSNSITWEYSYETKVKTHII